MLTVEVRPARRSGFIFTALTLRSYRRDARSGIARIVERSSRRGLTRMGS